MDETTQRLTANSFGLFDRVEECIERCRQRFRRGDSRLSYYVTTVARYRCFPDESIDFVFSLDSLVHPRGEIRPKRTSPKAWFKKLKTSEVRDFIHHSNLANTRVHATNAFRNPVMKAAWLRRDFLDRERHRDPTIDNRSVPGVC